MATNPSGQFQIPAEMRAFAEKSVEQAKQAFEGFIAIDSVTVFGLAFSPDGKQVLTGSSDGTARLFHLGTGKQLWRVQLEALPRPNPQF